MPTLKPRVSITMETADLLVLDRYASASGTPRATIISGLLSSAIPQLQRAAELIELANEAPLNLRRSIVDNLSNATSDALGFLEPFNSDYQRLLNTLQYELALSKPKRREGLSVLACDAPGGLHAALSPSDTKQPKSTIKRRPDPLPLTGGSK